MGADGLSHGASQSILSMVSSNAGRSQSNIYLDDPDNYHHYQQVQHLPGKYSVSTMHMPSMVAASASHHGLPTRPVLKNATSMQQLKASHDRPSNDIERQSMMMDQDQSQQQQQQQKSTFSIPDVYEQQLMHERLMCVQQMIASGQNLASIFNDDPHFAQQIMTFMSPEGYYPQLANSDEPEVIEIMDE
jgi:hypothetical protein